jgi:MOSC domain-containing protein YiiM
VDPLLLSINTSNGGVPKHPRHEALVGAGGVDGDRQRDLVHHGGSDRAVCLYSFDLIRALQHEGHSPSIGVLGENLTIGGIDWSRMTTGARLAVGDVRMRVTGYAVPCRNLSSAFIGGGIARISQKVHPGWSRVYARVEEPGIVHIGDRVEIEPPEESSESAGPDAGGRGAGARSADTSRLRVSRTGVLHVGLPVADAFPFFTPDGERLWVPGWDPEYLHPQSGEQGAGAIFETTHNHEHTLWLVLRLSPDAGVAEYARITPGSRRGIVRVSAEPAGPSSTRVTVTYDLTAISDDGDRTLRALTAERFGAMVAEWESRIARALEGSFD